MCRDAEGGSVGRPLAGRPIAPGRGRVRPRATQKSTDTLGKQLRLSCATTRRLEWRISGLTPKFALILIRDFQPCRQMNFGDGMLCAVFTACSAKMASSLYPDVQNQALKLPGASFRHDA